MNTGTRETRMAYLRASVKWLLSKAFNNQVPDMLVEPFYLDQDNQERLKPQIVVELGNASLYCQALSNLYSDPNYQSLHHSSILQTLARKGVPVAETSDMPLTETVLIQTNPLKLNAHMLVIESIMLLYAKEIASGERIQNAIRRISGSFNASKGLDFEKLLLLWVSHICGALKRHIDQEMESASANGNSNFQAIPQIPPVKEIQDLCDGVCLALIIAYYCPKVVSWTSVRICHLPTVEDSIHNILIVNNFSQKHLPYPVFHMNPEDVAYIRGSMRPNLIVLLADLFNLFEIHPAKCVAYRGQEVEVAPTKISSITSQRHNSTPPVELQTLDLGENGYTEDTKDFTVYKSRGVATLSTMYASSPNNKNQESLYSPNMRQAKEKGNTDTKLEERGDYAPAGRPSNWEHNRRPSYAGRRSRRNSSSEDSQLTIENFGGSQDNLNFIGNYERDNLRERKVSNSSIEPAVAVRSSLADARGTLQIGYDTDSGSEKQDRDTEKKVHQSKLSVENVSSPKLQQSVSRVSTPKQHSSDRDSENQYNASPTEAKHQKSASIPNSSNFISHMEPANNKGDFNEDDVKALLSSSKLNSIRNKLEEKRIRLEQDKRRIELALSRHRDKNDDETKSENMKWDTLSNESNYDLDIDSDDMEKYQESISIMNSNLQDIQADIQRLTVQQSQIQIQHSQAQHIMKVQHISSLINQLQPYGSQQHLPGHYQQRPLRQKHNFGSTPHLPQALNATVSAYHCHQYSCDPYQQPKQPQPMQYGSEVDHYCDQTLPPHRGFRDNLSEMSYNNYPCRDYGYVHQPAPNKQYPYYVDPKQINRPPMYNDYAQMQLDQGQNSSQPYHFYLHESSTQYAQPNFSKFQSQQAEASLWRNAAPNMEHCTQEQLRNSPWSKQQQLCVQNSSQNGDTNEYGYEKNMQNLFPVHMSTQWQQIQSPPRQHSLPSLEDQHTPYMKKTSQTPKPQVPPDDLMAPQSICFIGDEEDIEEIEKNIIENLQSTRLSDFHYRQAAPTEVLKYHVSNTGQHNPEKREEENTNASKINISSGNLTYRIPSPSRPVLNANSFQNPNEAASKTEKGFYISFGDTQPKRPKPPLRAKRSPKKEKSLDKVDHQRMEEQELNIQQQKRIDEKGEFPNSFTSNKGTYNKYTDPPIGLIKLTENNVHSQQGNNSFNNADRRHLEDVTNQQQIQSTLQQTTSTTRSLLSPSNEKSLVVDTDVANLNPESVDEMERRKEKIMLLSLQRRQQQEEAKARKEIEANKRREREREKEEERARKKEEQMARRASILEQYRQKKAMEEAERDGKVPERPESITKQSHFMPRLRQQKIVRPRPKTIHGDSGSVDLSESSSISSRGKKGSNTNISAYGSNSLRRDSYKGSQDSLIAKADSGLGRSTPPRRAPSPSVASTNRYVPSPSGPGSLPPGLVTKRRGFDDGASDISSTPNSMQEYSGPKLYKQPAAKSNRGIILNAVEYCVFPGAVNRDSKQKVLEKIARSEAKHFLVLFRDAGCQFRALYSYSPETAQVLKLYGTGPSQVDEVMFDKFFKYNSGGKCFSQVHTKHLTVTIDAFTIHNSLWQGKKVHLPNKKDMALVI